MNKFLAKITFYERPWLWKAFLAVALLAGFGLRMINLQNPPLDFASTRQLFSALKARAIYYEYLTNVPEATRNQAISLGDVGIVEPPLLENIVAQTYRLTGEHLWIARIYSSFFWVIAGLALFLLIREFASTSEAMIGAVYLDGGLEPVRELLKRTVFLLALESGERISESDRKSALQEYLQGRGEPPAEYRLAGETGPDHQKTFQVQVWVQGECLASAEGSTKKEAEQRAARSALERLQQVEANASEEVEPHAG